MKSRFFQLLLGAHGVFWLFGAVLVSSVAFVYVLVPEARIDHEAVFIEAAVVHKGAVGYGAHHNPLACMSGGGFTVWHLFMV